MRLTPEALSNQLKKSLLPVYLLFGSEPFLVEESAIHIRNAFTLQYAGEHIIFTLENTAQSTWDELLLCIQNQSLFSDKRLFELRFSSTKITAKELTPLKLLLSYAGEDTFFLLMFNSLTKVQQQSVWFTAAESKGAIVAHWPLNEAAFRKWIDSRIKQKGLKLPEANLSLLIYHTEGNYLAAAQEIDRLALLYSNENMNEVSPFTQLAQFTVFDLLEAALQGNSSRVLKILHGLRTNGTAIPLVIWALSQALRTLIQIKGSSEDKSKQAIFQKAGIRPFSQPLYIKRLTMNPPPCEALLAHLFSLDKVVKSSQGSEFWHQLAGICLQLAGVSNSVIKNAKKL